jgi:hypothetical protein
VVFNPIKLIFALMIIHEQTLISEDVLEKNFICNLGKCKGACCVEGEQGAPVSKEEITLIEKDLEQIKPYLTPQSIKAIEAKGFWETDPEGDLVTTCLPTGECNFSIYKDGILGCGIEQAWKDGKTTFRKPISCHLYPIRISQVGEYDALNYHRWDVCKPACKLGNEHKVPVYRFLKDALIRKYGEAWYAELDGIAEALNG